MPGIMVRNTVTDDRTSVQDSHDQSGCCHTNSITLERKMKTTTGTLMRGVISVLFEDDG